LYTLYTTYTMAKKLVCEECSYHSIVFTEENTKIIRQEQSKYILQGKRRSVEQIVNRMILEWNVDRKVEQLENIKADEDSKKQKKDSTNKK